MLSVSGGVQDSEISIRRESSMPVVASARKVMVCPSSKCARAVLDFSPHAKSSAQLGR